MDSNDREEIKKMIQEAKDKSGCVEFIFTLLMIVILFTFIAQPLIFKVVMPFWYEVTGWEWLAK